MLRFLFTSAWIVILLLAMGPSAVADELADSTQAAIELFERSVRPVLVARCFECHGAEDQQNGLRLDSRAAILAGGESGAVIDLDHPEQSLLLAAIRPDDDRLEMPPDGSLKDKEIAAIVRWVKLGLPWPETDATVRAETPPNRPKITDEDRRFWSFQPIENRASPEVRDVAWPQAPLDYFVLARLEAEGLRPVEPADKQTLIRRATFDLIGLPPSIEEIDAFLADDSPDAFARVVDRLLASPHHGERWGRHWLDVARYGEDQAHTFKARLYPEGYRYRDWVARALNDDMPYDRFIMEQIAADLLDGSGRRERLPALGFFSLGPVYYGDRKKLDQYDDRIDTLTRGFLGLTVACARCHDHKFDPIPSEDYYALAGVFASTEYAEPALAAPEIVAAYETAETAVDEANQSVEAFFDAEHNRWRDGAVGEIAAYMVSAWRFGERRRMDPEATISQLAKEAGQQTFLLKRWVEYLESAEQEAPTELAAWFELTTRLAAAPTDAASKSNAEAREGEVVAAAEAFQASILELLVVRGAEKGQLAAADGSGLDKKEAPTKDAKPSKSRQKLLDRLVGEKGLLAVSRDRLKELLSDEARGRLVPLQANVEAAKQAMPPKYAVAHALMERDEPTNLPVYLRGDPERPGKEAPRHFLSILEEQPSPFTVGSGRLELARAIAHRDNPLTARVMVNRIWQHHFGRGIVGTASNFGALGEPPTHPRLLDHLAHRFVESGWSMKALHREIMLSATYQMSSRFDPASAARDPENRLLWRMNRRRLEVEAWRDAQLAVSGRLDQSIGGPSLELAAPENRRRTFYAAISRHRLDGLLRLFDFPDPNITGAARTETTAPPQELFVLNSEFMMQNAAALAARLAAEAPVDDTARIHHAFRLLYGRPASEDELRLGQAFLASAAASEGKEEAMSPWRQYAQALLSVNEMMYID